MIEYLSGFMLPGREKVLRETLANRTRYMTICLENTYHPQNASALVRNCEAFGIQDIHTVETVCRFTPNANIVRGTDKWVDIRKHPDTPSLVGDLRDVRRRGRAVRAVLRYGACRDQRGGRRGGRRVRPHSDVRFRREPERVGLGGHPALPALVAVEGERRAVAHSGDRARRNPAALDALDRARFRTHSPAGRILDRLSVARAPRAAPVRGGVWKRCASGPYRSFLDPELFRIERPADTCVRGSCSGCRSRGFPRDVSGDRSLLRAALRFPLRGTLHASAFRRDGAKKSPEKWVIRNFWLPSQHGNAARRRGSLRPTARLCAFAEDRIWFNERLMLYG